MKLDLSLMNGRPEDFAPPLLRIQKNPPAPLAGLMLKLLLALLAVALLWAFFGKLDIVAVAEGKLVPASYLKILQPAESVRASETSAVQAQNGTLHCIAPSQNAFPQLNTH